MSFIEDILSLFRTKSVDTVVKDSESFSPTSKADVSRSGDFSASKEQLGTNKETILIEARMQAKEILFDAKDKALKIREETEDDLRKSKEKSLELEKNLSIKKAKLES